MSNRMFVTFHEERTNEEVDLELPGNKSLNELLPHLIKVLYWPNPDSENPNHYNIKTEEGSILDKSKKLIEQGVQNSDALVISVDANVIGESDSDNQSESPPDDEMTAYMAPSPQDRRGYFTPKRQIEFPISAPSLVSEKGYIFVIGEPPVLIGRKAMGVEPDINLSEIDYENISSKKHAEIYLDNSTYLLKPFNAKNGTFVNGVDVSPGSTRVLENSDVIQFGFKKGEKLTFRTP